MIYEFMPSQDLHGYDKPWAPGADINILPPSTKDTSTATGITIDQADGVYKFKGISTAYHMQVFNLPDDLAIVPADIAVAAFNNFANDKTFIYLRNNNTTVLSWGLSSVNRIMKDMVSTEEVTFNQVCYEFRAANVDVNGFIASPMIYARSDYDGSVFRPYSNICMPEGFNIWNPYNDEFIQVYAGYVNANTRELYLRPVYEEYDGEELVGPWMSSLDPYDEDTTPTAGAFVIDLGGDLTSFEITPFMLQTLLDSLGIRQHFLDGASLLNSLMDQAQGRVRSEDELLPDSLHVIPIGDSLPIGLHIRPISNDVLPGLPGKFIR